MSSSLKFRFFQHNRSKAASHDRLPSTHFGLSTRVPMVEFRQLWTRSVLVKSDVAAWLGRMQMNGQVHAGNQKRRSVKLLVRFLGQASYFSLFYPITVRFITRPFLH